MGQWVKVPAAKTAHLNSIPRSHMVEGKKSKLFFDFHRHIIESMNPYTLLHTANKQIKM